MPDVIASYTVLFLLLAIASAKVLSPQYLVWLVPLMPLLPWEDKLSRMVMIGYLAMLALTTVIFPYTYFSRVSALLIFSDQQYVRMPPTLSGLALLAARNLLLIATAAGVWLELAPRTAAVNRCVTLSLSCPTCSAIPFATRHSTSGPLPMPARPSAKPATPGSKSRPLRWPKTRRHHPGSAARVPRHHGEPKVWSSSDCTG